MAGNFQIHDKIVSQTQLVEASQVFKQSWQSAYAGIFDKQALANLDETIWQKSLRQTGRHNLLAIINEHVVGVASYGQSRDHPDAKTGELKAIYVLPHYQGKGIGTTF